MPKTKNPAFLDTARAFYADAFEHHRKKDIVAAIEAWSEMDGGEQSYAVAHLLYLNVHAQATTVRLLGDLRGLLDEVADGIDAALDDEVEEEPARSGEPEDVSHGDAEPDRVLVGDARGSAPCPESTLVAPAEVA